MKQLRRGLTFGLLIGLALVFGLVLVHGATLRTEPGVVTSRFLGLPVLRSTKVVLGDGGSQVELTPQFGLLVPLLLPSVLILAGHRLVRRRAGTRGTAQRAAGTPEMT